MSVQKEIAVLPGDGVGPEVIEEGIKILNAVAKRFSHKFNYKYAYVGAIAIDKTGNPLPDETLNTCINCDAILFGAIGHPKYDNDPNAKVRPEQGLLKLRKSLGLFANVRPVSTYESLLSLCPLKEDRAKGVDFVVYRELTGGIYFGDKGRSEDGKSAFDHCEYHTHEIERIAILAFEAAKNRNKKVTLVDKANVLETSRLWRETVQKLAQDYPGVKLELMFVDNAAMQLILNPRQFDVILTENMFGDIITDEASVLSGSLGLLPSASIGEKTALFEPIHGSYPQAAGKGIANPLATILSVAMMLESFDMHIEAMYIREIVNHSLTKGICTPDILPLETFSTSQVGDWISQEILSENFAIK